MDRLAERLMRVFLAELEERLRALNGDLVALEKATDGVGRAELITALFRTAHSLKGAAAAVGIGVIETVCHELESVFADARDGRCPLTPALFEALFAGADAIGAAGVRLREGQSVDGTDLQPLVGRLRSLAVAAPAEVQPREQPEVRRAAEAKREPPDAAGAGLIRVSAGTLDALLAQSGELLTAQRRTCGRADEAAAIRDAVRRWRHERPAARESANGAIPDGGRRDEAATRGRDRLRWLDRELDRLIAALYADSQIAERAAEAIVAEVSRSRMLPFREACAGLDRIARDIAASAGKIVRLDSQGGEVELDRAIIERLRDPLIHLVRNAVDHGIEAPARRRALGKPEEGRVVVAAALRGSRIEIVVADDGSGLDRDAVRTAAQRHGLPESDDDALAAHLFRPGFSTVAAATEVSGRGVGLDAVKAAIAGMRGAITANSTSGHGMRFVIGLPLTLSTLSALLVRVGTQVFAFDSVTVLRLVRVAPTEIRSLDGGDVLNFDGRPVPLVRLGAVLGLPAGDDRGAPPLLTVAVIASGERRAAFVVDEALGEQEVIVRGLGRRLRRVRRLAAATILPSGAIALILHSGELIDGALSRPATRDNRPAPPPRRRRIILADDSLTTRTLEKSILEAAGYDVLAFADGADAWDGLQRQGGDIVVTDVEMPRLDGFGLVEAIRGSSRFHELPVVLVTYRESEADKVRGLAVGANAYLVKSAFDQRTLLESVAQLL